MLTEVFLAKSLLKCIVRYIKLLQFHDIYFVKCDCKISAFFKSVIKTYYNFPYLTILLTASSSSSSSSDSSALLLELVFLPFSFKNFNFHSSLVPFSTGADLDLDNGIFSFSTLTLLGIDLEICSSSSSDSSLDFLRLKDTSEWDGKQPNRTKRSGKMIPIIKLTLLVDWICKFGYDMSLKRTRKLEIISNQ